MENLANVILEVRTGHDDKECGVFSVRLYQGPAEFFHREYGDGQAWNEGNILQESIALQFPVTGEAIRCVTALEERPGQRNITWDADIRYIRVTTNRNRQVGFAGPFRFDTDNHKPLHIFDMGSQNFV